MFSLRSRTALPRPVPAVLWLAAAFLAGCGVPGEPLPPLLEIPAPVQDLSVVQAGTQLQLAWSRPRLTTEGTRARRLDRMELYGAFLPGDAPLTSFSEQSSRLATILAQSLPETEERIVYTIPLDASHLGSQATFALKAINDRGRDAGFSNVVSARIANLPEPPSDVQLTLTEKAVRLSWKSSSQSVFGGSPSPPAPSPAPTIDGYQVFRQEAGSLVPAAVIGETPSPAYEDAAFEFEHRYVYSVRAFVRQGDSLAVTPLSAPGEVAAVDRFPPAPPENVRAVAAPGAVELAWSPSAEPDLAGYNVYRSEEAAFTKINSELLRIPVFRDATVRPGVRYRYQVRASDAKGNESGPSEEVPITAE